MRCLNGTIFFGLSMLIVGCGGGDDTAAATNPTGGTPTCEPTNAVCTAVTSDCLALEDNAGKTSFGVRMAQLTVTKPDVLASGFVSDLVEEAVRMNLPQCNLNGTGNFSWLIEFDTAAGTARTGGALPQTDPRQGYCFANQMVGMFQIQPIVVPSTITDGKFAGDIGDLIVPIFLSAGGTPITLPLHKTRIYDATLSADQNCIGTYNAAGLNPDNLCLPDDTNPAFINSAKLDGFITIEEADTVIVTDAGNQSLCVILSGDAATYGTGMSPNVCARDAMGQILLEGDWCSTTNAPADATCKDAFALGAEFAASAVKITGICQ